MRRQVTAKDVREAYYKKMSVGYVNLRPRKKVKSREVKWDPEQIEGEVK